MKERTEGRMSDEDLRKKQKEENCAIEKREREKVEAERGDREREREEQKCAHSPSIKFHKLKWYYLEIFKG